ncbi:hypothetical protein SAMN05192574_101175 [Mucilaginibacter gossypiicola]|uniref:Uncharacterized protein n=1 Tax=Mucilaginibacter gossypiicola TaxID=551995 RepID=A0A1H7ZUS5_9SPHI|nr:hypothetical protein [Mucilaginibacter gossypiicola]SEM61328.1 hypothetical protein SAMN05192574_101175 [Mucilaginibacter gossypiicola]
MKAYYQLSKNAIKTLLIVVACLLPSLVYSQFKTPGSVEYLKFCNGINGLTLGEDVAQIPSHKLSYLDNDDRPDADSCVRYQYKDSSLLVLGDSLSLDAIGFRTYKNKIVNIYLFFKMGDAYKILSDFLKAYGPFTGRPNNYADIYNWDTSALNLSLRYQVKTEMGVAIFSSKHLENEIAANKPAVILKDAYQSFSVLY